MFSKQTPEVVLADLSADLQDEQDWKVGTLKTFDFPLNITTFAIEPISRLLAVGTSDGIIHVFGRPGVECRITLPQPVEVRFLQFAISTFNIVCLDSENQLHVYSLLELGKPRYVTSARFDNINSITSSPSHSHIFLAAQHGDIKTYDLTCLRKSPYSIPNLWKLYEEKMASSGVPMLTPPDPLTIEAVDVVVHPRNLDLLFVIYAGGIILTDLTERSTIRAYELLLQPGAPGGAGYDANDILTHRRSMVTSAAIHPSGHFFAAGYADGSIAFWAVDDDNKPLLVRTLDALDVNILDPNQVESLLSPNQKAKAPSLPCSPEPIFKLSWSGFPNSDPRSGDTTLTILGGLTSDKPPGLTVFLFPPFNPPEAPTDPPAPASSVHPFYRKAMCQSLISKKTFFYETRGLVQDYLLLPHTSPHFAGNFDPYAILFISEVENTRTIEAYQYPPPGFIEVVRGPPTVEKREENEVEDKSTSDRLLGPPPPAPLPKSPRHMNYTPASLRTPFPLLSGNSGLIGGQLLNVDKDTYQTFIDDNTSLDPSLDLKGGHAYAETTSEMKLLKYQPHRILVTYNQDLSVRFFDFSSQLLLPNPTSNSLLENDWPEALPKLTIKLDEIFDNPGVTNLLVTPIQNISIQIVKVAQEALECAVVLQSGEILVYHPRESRPKPSSPNISADAQIVLLDHIYSPPRSKLVPFFMLTAEKGPIETCALSDIGFLAVSYQSGALVVIDMRGPRIMYTSEKIKKNRHSVISRPHIHLSGGAPGVLGHDSGIDVIRSLTWTVCSLDKDLRLSVRLIAVHQSGDTEAFTLLYSGSLKSWNIADEPAAIKAMADPIPNGTFVLDKKTGASWRADRGRFAASFQNIAATDISGRSVQPQCFMVTVGAKGARSSLSVNGDKIGKVEWGNKVGTVQTAQIVEHMGSRALVVQTDKHDGLIYSLPYLEYICTIQIPVVTPIPLMIDDVGDFIAFVPSAKSKSTAPIRSLVYGTLFVARRIYMPPDIDFASSRGTVPPQPQPVSLGPASLLGSWFLYKQTLSGNQIDELLGGPDRPIPHKITSERDTATTGQENMAGGAAAGFAASAAAVQTNIYNRLTSAMSERGQLLGDLEERFNSLEEGSRSMVAQAKKLAAQQTAKSWFGF